MQIKLTVGVQLGDGGNVVENILFHIGNSPISWSFNGGQITDSFKDNTPGTGESLVTFDRKNPPGDYPILKVMVWDVSGATTIYGRDQLTALGWPTSYTIINSSAPPPPTLAVTAPVSGLIAGNSAVLHGSGRPLDVVEVVGTLAKTVDNAVFDHVVELGKAQVAADGSWTLTTNALADGHYTNVIANEHDQASNSSVYSAPLEFYVATLTSPPPGLQTRADGAGNVSSARPFVSGWATAGSTVTVYDGRTVVASALVDSGGWYGTTTSTLSAGAHNLTAIASDPFQRTTLPSQALSVTVAAQPATGIHFDIASFTNGTAVALDPAVLGKLLDDVAAIFSSLIDGNRTIELAVSVTPTPGGMPWATAAAGASPAIFDVSSAMPTIPNAGLQISTTMASDLTKNPEATRSYVDVLAHEMLHAFGFNSSFELATGTAPAYKFGELTSRVGANLYFNGKYASTVNGGPVPLANICHLNLADDLMYYSTPVMYDDVTFFGKTNPTAPLSTLDLAILKDLGYQIKDTLMAQDGHTFIPGDGTVGHNIITGTDGLDTVLVNRNAKDFSIDASGGGYSLTDKVGVGGTEILNSIERLQFADNLLALDVAKGQHAGEAYRLYRAAFDRIPDLDGQGYWVKQIDHGATLLDVANAFVGSEEFSALYGPNLSDARFVTLLYANVLHRQPDQGGTDYWLNAMGHGATRATLLADFSESDENIAQVVGSVQHGIVFHPYLG